MGYVHIVKGFSNIITNRDWYGVQITYANTSPDLTRIGSDMTLHASLPVHSLMKGCLYKNAAVNYFLKPTDWTKKLDESASILDGTDGDVMVEIPEHYKRLEVISGGLAERRMISLYPIAGFTKIKKQYISAFEASLNRTNFKLSSVINLTTTYRGGSNTAAWDAQENTNLGRPATNITRTNYRTYARNNGGDMYWYGAHKTITDLFIIEYNTLNSQKAINAALDGNGYKQGGLGNGVTDVNSTKWGNFNGYNPFIPCGYSKSLGNYSGAVVYTFPFDWDAGAANYKGIYDAGAANVAGEYRSVGTALYICILNNTGELVTNATYWTAVTRSTTNVNGYHGIEMPFGHIWKNADGIGSVDIYKQ